MNVLRTALITGGAKGLGKHIAMTLSQAGYRVAISYLHSEREAEALVQAVRSSGGEAIALRADISDSAQLEALVQQTEAWGGGIDAVINNAGPFIRTRRRFADYTTEDIRYILDSNLFSAMALDRLTLPGMRKRGYGRIIHLGFAHASESRAWPHRAVYAAAKVGLVSFTKTLAVEEAEFGITVNMVCPSDIKGDNKEKSIAEVSASIDPESPRLRPGSGEDIARVVQFLLRPESDFITGAIIDVSGGMDPIRVWPLSESVNRDNK